MNDPICRPVRTLNMCMWREDCRWAKYGCAHPSMQESRQLSLLCNLWLWRWRMPAGLGQCSFLLFLEQLLGSSYLILPALQRWWAVVSQCYNGQVAWSFHLKALCGKWKLHFQCWCDLVLWHQWGFATFGSNLVNREHKIHLSLQAYSERRALYCIWIVILHCERSGKSLWLTVCSPLRSHGLDAGISSLTCALSPRSALTS